MKDHPRNPYLATDIIIEINEKILLIERRNAPFGWALPGGFVEYGEAVEMAAIREAKEETDIDIERVNLLGVYSDPDRDPRSHTVSVVFIATKFYGNPKAGDDAKNVKLFDFSDLPDLAFDHAQVIDDYMERKK